LLELEKVDLVREAVSQLDMESIITVVNLTILNTRCSFLINKDGLNLYDVRLICFIKVYSSKYWYTSLAKRCIVWISKKSRYILLLGLKTNMNVQY